MNRLTRRSVISGALLLPVAAVGIRGVTATNQTSTPEASPEASPMASPAAGAMVEVKAIDIDFEPSSFTIPADTDVTIHVVNEGLLQHDFIIEDTEFGTDLLDGGDDTELVVNLPAGEYTYYCSVPGHREAGMEGTLTVE